MMSTHTEPSVILVGKLRGLDANTQGHERDCRIRVTRKTTDADEQPAVHSDYIHFEIIDYKDDLPVGNYEVTFDGQTEKLRKTKEGRYFGR
jgi:hypothetical protein